MATGRVERYVLSLMTAGDDVDMVALESDTPFMTVSVGDLFNPSDFPSMGFGVDAGALWEVVRVEHYLHTRRGSKAGRYTHQVIAYVKNVPNSYATREQRTPVDGGHR